MDIRRYLVYLEEHRQEMLRDLEVFTTLETPSTEKKLLDAFADHLARYAGGIGATSVDIITQADAGNHVRMGWAHPGRALERPNLVLAHYDTVWPVGTLRELPFSIREGVARGPGVFDMKAGLVQGLWAMRAILAGGAARRSVTFVCNSDEEIGSETSRRLIEDEARQAAAVFVLEPSRAGALKTSRKGQGTFSIEVQGRAAHAGLDPEAGISAIDEIARIILDLEALADPFKGTTVNIGVIGGGTRSNVVAAFARAEVDIRARTMTEADRVGERIRALRPSREGLQLHVAGGLTRPPLERTAGVAQLYERARALASEIGLELSETSVGGASDGNLCAAVGTPVLDGLGAVGDGAHAPDEHVAVEEMPRRAALLAALLEHQ